MFETLNVDTLYNYVCSALTLKHVKSKYMLIQEFMYNIYICTEQYAELGFIPLNIHKHDKEVFEL